MQDINPLRSKASTWAKRLGKIKSVEAIFLSGSLAQGHGDENSDIDFFILAKPGQIWTARFKVFTKLKLHRQLAKPHDHAGKICPNHFITTDSLEIAEKDAYSANLFSHNIPLYDPQDYFEQFIQANQWVLRYGEEFEQQYSSTPRQDAPPTEPKTKKRSTTESLLRSLQVSKIKHNREYKTPGARIILSDQELRFHPKPKNKSWKKAHEHTRTQVK